MHCIAVSLLFFRKKGITIRTKAEETNTPADPHKVTKVKKQHPEYITHFKYCLCFQYTCKCMQLYVLHAEYSYLLLHFLEKFYFFTWPANFFFYSNHFISKKNIRKKKETIRRLTKRHPGGREKSTQYSLRKN